MDDQGNFLGENNQKVLWDVMKDNGILNNTPERTKMFQTYIYEFYEKYKTRKMDLMDRNKMFIQLLIQKIGTELPNESNLTTNEEIKKYRKDNFDRKLEQKQNEFFEGIHKKPPETPNFQDNIEDEKVSDTSMAQTIQEMIKERNLDISYTGVQKKEAEEWLGSSSQSQNNKDKKLSLVNPELLQKRESDENFKFINIAEEELGEEVPSISLDEDKNNILTKRVSWQDSLKETETTDKVSLTTSDLFSKLKRTDFSSASDPVALEKVIPGETNLVTKEDLEKLYGYIEEKFKKLEDIILSSK
jgi:hypothetical protein